jgi:hypothetical protein
MNRVLIYSTEQLRLYDLLEMAKHPLVSEGYVVADLLGLGGSNVTAGFAPTYNSNLTITFGTGRLYTLQVVDATIYGGTPGGLAADSNIIAQSAENAIQTLTFSTASLSSGQALYALVEVSYAQTDVIEASDPTSGLLTYLNPSNPTTPWIGPNNTGVTQPTTRAAQAVLTIKYGSPATSGAQVPPTVDVGNVPLYLVTLSFGQTSITSANVVVAGPSAAVNVPSNYPAAPFIAGLLNSHHSGAPGQAPQIKLASEVQGTLPLGNLPATNSVGTIPTVRTYAGNPNTNVAGQVQDFVWDTTHAVMWECTTTGTTSTAIWKAVGAKMPGGTILDDGTGNVVGNGSTPTGITGISGLELVMLTSPINLTGIGLIATGASTTLNIGSAYPNAKIAIIRMAIFIDAMSSAGNNYINVSVSASGTASNQVISVQNLTSNLTALYGTVQQVLVPLTPGSNPSFRYAITINGNITVYSNQFFLDGFYQ